MITTLTVKGRALLLDEILAETFGARVGRDLVSETLELNPHLSALGRRIPVGTVIRMPLRPSRAVEPALVVSLFG